MGTPPWDGWVDCGQGRFGVEQGADVEWGVGVRLGVCPCGALSCGGSQTVGFGEAGRGGVGDPAMYPLR